MYWQASILQSYFGGLLSTLLQRKLRVCRRRMRPSRVCKLCIC